MGFKKTFLAICLFAISSTHACKEDNQSAQQEKPEIVYNENAPKTKLFFENGDEEIFCCKILPFIKDIKVRAKLRFVCGYFNHIINKEWKAFFRDASQETVNKELIQSSKHGYKKLVEFLATDKTTKALLTPEATNEALEITKDSETFQFLLTTQTTKEKITKNTINKIIPSIENALTSFQDRRKNLRCIITFLLNEDEINENNVNTQLIDAAKNGFINTVALLLRDILTTKKITPQGLDRAIDQAETYRIKSVLRNFKKTGTVKIPEPPKPQPQHPVHPPFPANPFPHPRNPFPPLPPQPFPPFPGAPSPFGPDNPDFFPPFYSTKKKLNY